MRAVGLALGLKMRAEQHHQHEKKPRALSPTVHAAKMMDTGQCLVLLLSWYEVASLTAQYHPDCGDSRLDCIHWSARAFSAPFFLTQKGRVFHLSLVVESGDAGFYHDASDG